MRSTVYGFFGDVRGIRATGADVVTSGAASSAFGPAAAVASAAGAVLRPGLAAAPSRRRSITGRAGAVKLLLVATALTAVVSGQILATANLPQLTASALTTIVHGATAIESGSVTSAASGPATGGSSATVASPSTVTVPDLTGAAFAAAYAGNIGAAITTLSSMTAVQVATVWHGLPETERQQLLTAHPEVIGNLEGVDYSDRSAANTSRLPELVRGAEAGLAALTANSSHTVSQDVQAAAIAAATLRLDALKVLEERYARGGGAAGTDAGSTGVRNDLDTASLASVNGASAAQGATGAGGSVLTSTAAGSTQGAAATTSMVTITPPQQEHLITLDASQTGQPRIAVAVGDVDTAEYVTVFVPGMNSSALELGDYLRGVKRIQAASPSSAVVLWIGSKSPSALEVMSNERAEQGAPLLAAMLGGYNAFREAAGVASHLTVVAHSYGTATAALALASADFNVESFVMIGSAGIPTSVRIGDLHVPTNKVFASQASADALANLGQMLSGRANPAAAGWGATVFGSDGITLGDGDSLAAVEGHNAVGSSTTDDRGKYLGPGSETLYSIQKIVVGQTSAVPDDHSYAAGPSGPSGPSSTSTVTASAK